MNKEPVKYAEFYDDHVTEGHQYEYRVAAINAAGAGKSSETSSVFIAKPMKEKPKLNLDALIGRKIKVRAGEPINVNIPLSGAPTPTIEWTKGGRPLLETLRISVRKDCDLNILLTSAAISFYSNLTNDTNFRPKRRVTVLICWWRSLFAKTVEFTLSQRRTNTEEIPRTSRSSWSIDPDHLKVRFSTLAPLQNLCLYPGTNLWTMVDPTSRTTSWKSRTTEWITGDRHLDTVPEPVTLLKDSARARSTCSEYERRTCTACRNLLRANQLSPRVHTIHPTRLASQKFLDTLRTAAVSCGNRRSTLVASLSLVRNKICWQIEFRT